MRISVIHTTNYAYDTAVFHEPHTFRLRPRSDAAQNLLRYSIEITPAPAGRTWCLDQDGNVVLEAWFNRPTERLAVSSSFEVETLRDNPYDFLLTRREPDAAQSSILAPYLEQATQSEQVSSFASSIGNGSDPLTFLTGLNRVLFEQFGHTIRDEGRAQSAEETLAAQSGACRDLAVLFCAAARQHGIPARFVSGYEREASVQERADMHAWAEVYLVGAGWRGFDPSQGLAVSASHVAVAASADPRLAAPVSGTYRGSAGASMTYSLAMQVNGS